MFFEKIFKLEKIDSQDLWTLDFGLTTIENASRKMQSYEKVLNLVTYKKNKVGRNQDSTKFQGRMHKLEHGRC
jgi:hypothetical protein